MAVNLHFFGTMQVLVTLMLLFSSQAWAVPQNSLNQAVDQLMHKELLATLAGVKPVSWVHSGRSECEGPSLANALSNGQLQPKGLRWLVIRRASRCADPQFDIYAINLSAVDRLLQRQEIQDALAKLRQPVLVINREGILRRFEELARYWSGRTSAEFIQHVELNHDFHFLLGVLLGFRVSDVEEFARHSNPEEAKARAPFYFSKVPGFELGVYVTFSPLDDFQRQQQHDAKNAVERYNILRAHGFSPVQILNSWASLPDCDQLVLSRPNLRINGD